MFLNDQLKKEFIDQNGDIYKGQFENDKFNGLGLFQYKDGTILKGRFKDDLMIGKFINKDPDNRLYEVIFQNDKIVNEYNEITEEILSSGKYSKLGISSLADLSI